MKKLKWLVVLVIVVLALAMFMACTDKGETPADEQVQTETPGDNPGTTPDTPTQPAQPTPAEVKAAQKSAISGAINGLIENSSFAKSYLDKLNKSNTEKKDAAVNKVADKLVEAGFKSETISTIFNNISSLAVEGLAYEESDEEAEKLVDLDKLPAPIPEDGNLARALDKYEVQTLFEKPFIDYAQACTAALAAEGKFDDVCDAVMNVIDEIPVDSVKNLITMYLTDASQAEEGEDQQVSAAALAAFVNSDACETILAEMLGATKAILAKNGGMRDELQSVLAAVSGSLALAFAEEQGEEVPASGADGENDGEDLDESDEAVEIDVAGIVAAIFDTINYEAVNNAGEAICAFVDALRESGEFELALNELANIFAEPEADEADEDNAEGSESVEETVEAIDFSGVLVGVKFFGLTLQTLEKEDAVKFAKSTTSIIEKVIEMYSEYINTNSESESDSEPVADNAPEDEDYTGSDTDVTGSESAPSFNPMMLFLSIYNLVEAPIKYLGDILYKAYVALGETDQAVLEGLVVRFAHVAESDDPTEAATPIGDLLTFLHSKDLYVDAIEGLTEEQIEALDPELYFAQGEVLEYVFAFFGLGGNSGYEPEPIEIVGYKLVLDTPVLAGEPLKGSLRFYGIMGNSEVVNGDEGEETNTVVFEDENDEDTTDTENSEENGEPTDGEGTDGEGTDDDGYFDYDVSLDASFTIEKVDGEVCLIINNDMINETLVSLYGEDYFDASKFSLEANDFDNDEPGDYTITISFDDEEFPVAEKEFLVNVIKNLKKDFNTFETEPISNTVGSDSFCVFLSFLVDDDYDTEQYFGVQFTKTEEYNEESEEYSTNYTAEIYTPIDWFTDNGYIISEDNLSLCLIGDEDEQLDFNKAGVYPVSVSLYPYDIEFNFNVTIYEESHPGGGK